MFNQVLTKHLNIDIYSAQYIIDLANEKHLKLYWKIQFDIVLNEMPNCLLNALFAGFPKYDYQKKIKEVRPDRTFIYY